VKTRYDGKHDILYIDVAPGKKACDTQPLDDDIFVDLDEEGNIVGIEVWSASRNIAEPMAEQLLEKVRKALETTAEKSPAPRAPF